jgi:pSer/pThr/pTyr-binding forkhead associated (FHA) protein
MSATVTLKVVQGPQRGAEFAYRLATLCTVGRGQDCSLRLPNDVLNCTVSRHHCLLEIDPPLVRVCDLGSLNGTFVNGEPLGQREPHGRIADLGVPFAPDYALEDGDELRVGENVFRVCVEIDNGAAETVPCGPPGEEGALK